MNNLELQAEGFPDPDQIEATLQSIPVSELDTLAALGFALEEIFESGDGEAFDAILPTLKIAFTMGRRSNARLI